jgi:hypothetical protein
VSEVYQYRQAQARKTLLAFLIFLPILLIVGILIEFSKVEQSFQDFVATQGGVFLMIVGLFALLLTVSGAFTYIISLDAKRQRLTIAEGNVTVFNGVRWYRGTSYPTYELTLRQGLGRTKFRFPNVSSLRYFESGKRYRLYYIKFYPFPLLLSAEVVE